MQEICVYVIKIEIRMWFSSSEGSTRAFCAGGDVVTFCCTVKVFSSLDLLRTGPVRIYFTLDALVIAGRRGMISK